MIYFFPVILIEILIVDIFFKDALGELDTPGGASKPGQKVGTPLTDVINRNLKVALANSTRNASEMQALSASPQLPKTSEMKVRQDMNQLLKMEGILRNSQLLPRGTD